MDLSKSKQNKNYTLYILSRPFILQHLSYFQLQHEDHRAVNSVQMPGRLQAFPYINRLIFLYAIRIIIF